MSDLVRTTSPSNLTTEPCATQQPAAKPTPLESEDFYYENGLMVFTVAYHLKRGYCCNSGCRHCPFR